MLLGLALTLWWGATVLTLKPPGSSSAVPLAAAIAIPLLWRGDFGPRLVAMAAMLAVAACRCASSARLRGDGIPARFDFDLPWMPSLGIDLHLGVDGFNVYLLLLGAALFPVVLACTWKRDPSRGGRCISR